MKMLAKSEKERKNHETNHNNPNSKINKTDFDKT